MYAGFVREIDSVGRIVIPMQLRKELGLLDPGSKLELFCDGKQIVAKKALKDCVFCGSNDELIELDGKHICRTCLDKLKSE